VLCIISVIDILWLHSQLLSKIIIKFLQYVRRYYTCKDFISSGQCYNVVLQCFDTVGLVAGRASGLL